MKNPFSISNIVITDLLVECFMNLVETYFLRGNVGFKFYPRIVTRGAVHTFLVFHENFP